ncbi:MAG: helix-turn-helix domain-containing protein [Bacteroidales bacterium]
MPAKPEASTLSQRDKDLLGKIRTLVEEHLSEEHFGVSELATSLGMSRSNLLRKLQKLAGMSVSQFIREIRLEEARKLLHEGEHNVSEISFLVGFGSSSYFIKCFREKFGHPPGEYLAQGREPEPTPGRPGLRSRWGWPVLAFLGLALIALGIRSLLGRTSAAMEKSIAVLPFVNDSSDSTNLYIVNGLMESILDHLQKIEDLRVVSRTSVEKYRGQGKRIPEIARELDVNYIVEGSGQKIGEELLLHVQLIDARADRHLWSQRYRRGTEDVFRLQQDVAAQIAREVEVIVTPEEKARMERIPTKDLVAYDHFLKGQEFYYRSTREGLMEAIPYFQKAIELDPGFARAHASLAFCYYLLDFRQAEQTRGDLLRIHAEKAMELDSQLSYSQLARAMVEIHDGTPAAAVPYLEKALEFQPNSATVINILSDFYANTLPHTEKYLQYALKGIQLDIGSKDSLTASYVYLHTGNALVQTGFLEEGNEFIQRSLSFRPGNVYAAQVDAYLQFALHDDLEETRRRLMKIEAEDPGWIEILEEIANTCFYLGDWECAYAYYHRTLDKEQQLRLNAYSGEYAKMAHVAKSLGRLDEADSLLHAYKAWADATGSIYKELSLAAFYSSTGSRSQALAHMQNYASQDNFNYWIYRFLQVDPLFDFLRGDAIFEEALGEIQRKFQESHIRVKALLREQDLI